MSNEPEAKGEAETAINIVDALRGQQEQLKRLVAQPVWISKAQRSTLSELETQVTRPGCLARITHAVCDRDLYRDLCGALLSLIATALMSDHTGKDIEGPRHAAAIAAE